jgi:hypothetical protein
MKKFLSLALAVVMLTSIALAAEPGSVLPGETIYFKVVTTGAGAYEVAATADDGDFNGAGSVIGDVWLLQIDDGSGGAVALPAGASDQLLTKHYSITSLKYAEGKSFVASVKIDDDKKAVAIAFKQSYTTVVNEDKPVKLSFTLKTKGLTDNASVYYELDQDTSGGTAPAVVGSTGSGSGLLVGYGEIQSTVGEHGEEVYFTEAEASKNIFKAPADFASTLVLETKLPTAELKARVYPGEKYFLKTNNKANEDVLKANPDVVDIEFLNFVNTPTFTSNASLYFYVDENVKIYKLNANGTLSKTNAKWDSDEEAWVIVDRTLGSYVVTPDTLKTADEASSGSAAPGEVENPDTGANDVAGIAAALAAVALVSAAAVSLKK